MNRHRNENRTPAMVYFALFIAAAIVAGGGIFHAYCKNQQVQISRDIDQIDRRVEQCRLDIRTTEMRMDQLLNRFTIRQQLVQSGSSLRPIVMGVTEEIDDKVSSRHSVASAIP